jgi:hypothetical protein
MESNWHKKKKESEKKENTINSFIYFFLEAMSWNLTLKLYLLID